MGLKKEDYLILKKVASENNHSLDELIEVYGKESSFGDDLNRKGSQYKGPFQFGKDAGKDAGLVGIGRDGVEFDYRNDLAKSAKGYIDMVAKNRKSLNHYLRKYGINDSELLKFDKSTVNYMLHQQSARGLASILKSITNPITEKMPKGFYGSQDKDWGYLNPRARILENLTDPQKDYFKYKTENVPAAARYFLNSVKEQLDSIDYKSDVKIYEKDIKKKDDTSFFFPDDRVMNEALG
tara:strand:+ start:1855 stop:2568 length:714 start_codon:yes stop_codon:yes gene_type:complete